MNKPLSHNFCNKLTISVSKLLKKRLLELKKEKEQRKIC